MEIPSSLSGTPPGEENGQVSAVHHPSSSSSSTSSEGGQVSNANSITGSRAKRSNSEKGPRVRTVLSEQQLQTLRTVYASNPRPDALLKEHLVEITGLSPRVIRVWFQNKRCKDKKRVIQAEAMRLQQQQGIQKVCRPIAFGTGWYCFPALPLQVMPPLTPQTPLTPDSMGQMSPHPGMPAFTYPAVPTSYDLPTTPTPPGVSPIVTYHQNPAWGSPTEASMSPFEAGGDFSSPMVSGCVPRQVGLYTYPMVKLQHNEWIKETCLMVGMLIGRRLWSADKLNERLHSVAFSYQVASPPLGMVWVGR